MKECAEEGRNTLRLILNYFEILTVYYFFYRDFLKLTKGESYQNGSR